MKDYFCSIFGSKKLKTRIKEIKKIEKKFLDSQNKIITLVDKMIEKQNLIDSLFNAIPDWIWHKDLDGVYVQVNDKIREELFCGLCESEIIGYTDVQIAKKLKAKFGDNNHTFGLLCNSSDAPTIEAQEPMKFNEWGKVQGKELRVIVHKNVVRNACGAIVGTTGVGYNITNDYNYIQEMALLTTDKNTQRMLNEFNNRDIFTLDKSKKANDE